MSLTHRAKNLNDAPTPISTRPQTPPGSRTLETSRKSNKRGKKKVRHIYCLACTDALTRYHTQVQKAENPTTEATIPPESASPKRDSIQESPVQPGQVSLEGVIGFLCYPTWSQEDVLPSKQYVCRNYLHKRCSQDPCPRYQDPDLVSAPVPDAIHRIELRRRTIHPCAYPCMMDPAPGTTANSTTLR